MKRAQYVWRAHYGVPRYRKRKRIDAGVPRTSPHANTEAVFLRARRAGAQELGQERVSVQDAQVLARALTEGVLTERREKEVACQHNKVIRAAIETVLEGSAAPEETEHLVGLVVEFHKLETKRNRDRACEIRRRSHAFKDMNAVPFFGKAVYIDAAVLRGMTHMAVARSVIEANNMKLVNAP